MANDVNEYPWSVSTRIDKYTSITPPSANFYRLEEEIAPGIWEPMGYWLAYLNPDGTEQATFKQTPNKYGVCAIIPEDVNSPRFLGGADTPEEATVKIAQALGYRVSLKITAPTPAPYEVVKASILATLENAPKRETLKGQMREIPETDKYPPLLALDSPQGWDCREQTIYMLATKGAERVLGYVFKPGRLGKYELWLRRGPEKPDTELGEFYTEGKALDYLLMKCGLVRTVKRYEPGGDGYPRYMVIEHSPNPDNGDAYHTIVIDKLVAGTLLKPGIGGGSISAYYDGLAQRAPGTLGKYLGDFEEEKLAVKALEKECKKNGRLPNREKERAK